MYSKLLSTLLGRHKSQCKSQPGPASETTTVTTTTTTANGSHLAADGGRSGGSMTTTTTTFPSSYNHYRQLATPSYWMTAN
ncbi:hypothetical protein KIN20_033693 [Parelaphostrongylus tenuis]|uniref:Uncharacterized protein n=1 Tax=Parelaphostrongylus tenuis TaxID=148309 RepID=A0AAD5WJ42_PARTN|nr:hypothetical protein KIN20_033693 [Parelaphostrongylus tenuis]